jgi:hypothetical protein
MASTNTGEKKMQHPHGDDVHTTQLRIAMMAEAIYRGSTTKAELEDPSDINQMAEAI